MQNTITCTMQFPTNKLKYCTPRIENDSACYRGSSQINVKLKYDVILENHGKSVVVLTVY